MTTPRKFDDALLPSHVELAGRYYPYVITYNYPQTKKQKWSLSIQAYPDPKLILKGTMPTALELLMATQTTVLPHSVMLQMMMVLACVAEQEDLPLPLVT